MIYKHLTPTWQEFWDLIEQDKAQDYVSSVKRQLEERSRIPPHSAKPPKPDALIELCNELADYMGVDFDLSSAWQGK